MANTIKIKNSGTASNVPSSLEFGELAINYADGKLFYKNGGGAVVEFSSGGGSSVSVSDTAPSSPSSGDLWYDSSTQVMYIYYNDGSSSQWVEVVAGAGGGAVSYLTANLSGGYSIPGVFLTQEASNQSIAANTAYYQPFIVGEEITVSSIRLYVQTASGTSGAKLRLSIYESDADWVPGDLVLDAGEVACDSTGSKSISISQTLSPGYYFMRVHGDGSASRPLLYTWRGFPISGAWTGPDVQYYYEYKSSKTYGTAEDPASPSPSVSGTSSAPFLYFTRMVY